MQAQYVNNDPGYIGCKKKECKKYDQKGKCLVKKCSASVINIIIVAICALLDYVASSLSKVADAVTALSCEVLKTDTTTAFNFFTYSRDGFSDKDSASVDSDLKFMKMNDKKKKAAGKGKKNDKKKKALGKGTTILMEFIRNRLKMNDVEEEEGFEPSASNRQSRSEFSLDEDENGLNFTSCSMESSGVVFIKGFFFLTSIKDIEYLDL
ncbi:hypothetical protein Tco_0143850 [Tanacetum coccineum]